MPGGAGRPARCRPRAAGAAGRRPGRLPGRLAAAVPAASAARPASRGCSTPRSAGRSRWLLPAALILLDRRPVADARARREPTESRARCCCWGGWTVVTALVFSLMEGTFHAYYTVALAPGVAALVAIGAREAWRVRDTVDRPRGARADDGGHGRLGVGAARALGDVPAVAALGGARGRASLAAVALLVPAARPARRRARRAAPRSSPGRRCSPGWPDRRRTPRRRPRPRTRAASSRRGRARGRAPGPGGRMRGRAGDGAGARVPDGATQAPEAGRRTGRRGGSGRPRRTSRPVRPSPPC